MALNLSEARWILFLFVSSFDVQLTDSVRVCVCACTVILFGFFFFVGKHQNRWGLLLYRRAEISL